mmetsp:Transcript_2417/g.6446  ORF Transcript_2417/g.6446 Transcript_2417/m.6446 type:complete len:206 (+) Transcript_2417:143-760(+)
MDPSVSKYSTTSEYRSKYCIASLSSGIDRTMMPSLVSEGTIGVADHRSTSTIQCMAKYWGVSLESSSKYNLAMSVDAGSCSKYGPKVSSKSKYFCGSIDGMIGLGDGARVGGAVVGTSVLMIVVGGDVGRLVVEFPLIWSRGFVSSAALLPAAFLDGRVAAMTLAITASSSTKRIANPTLLLFCRRRRFEVLVTSFDGCGSLIFS